MIRLLTVAAIVAWSAAAAAEPTLVPGISSPIVASPDSPRGSPYHIAESDNTIVPLRDYISSRLDSLRIEVLDRISEESKHAREVLDERDRQYAQRFAAQEQATDKALVSVKESSASALSAAKEAVAKAEEASNKRFDGVNEFRKTLSDQTIEFIRKSEANVHFTSIDEKVALLQSRLDTITGASNGAGNLWVLILGIIATGGVLLSAYLGLRHVPRGRAS